MKKFVIACGLLLFSIGLAGSARAAQQSATGPKIAFIDPMGATGLGQADSNLSPLGMFEAADGVVKAVILILILASVITWTIGIAKALELRRERDRVRSALAHFQRSVDLAGVGDTGSAALADMTLNAEDEIALSARASPRMSAEGIKERIAMRLERVEAAMRRRVSRGIGILAIVSSTAPFVGLFGTVWGIMNSFIGIAHSHTTNLAVVAPGIAEALLTTAAGLVAAIPAGIMYNLFARSAGSYAGELGDAAATVLCLASRDVDCTMAKA